MHNTSFTTPGERRFYAFLRDAIKPDSQCFAWYSPFVDGLEPDFVLYTPELGLIVFEVKDWLLEQIQEADQRSFALRLPDGREERRTHPLQQAREYMFAILNRIKSTCAQLTSSDPRYLGKARLPLECAVVFSNITRDAFCAANLHKVVPVEKVFADDLELVMATTDDSLAQRKIREQLLTMLPPRFPFQLSTSDIAALRDVLWPNVRLTLPRRAGLTHGDAADSEILRMDAQQESLARRLDAKAAIVQGPAGSGKTLVLVHKAVQEFRRLQNKGAELPVLLICFNLTLVHYLKRLVAEHRVPLGTKGIRVTHFYDLCHSLLAEPLAYENEDTDYYRLVTQMALDAAPHSEKYGAIFVDEGQDFSDAMMAVLHAICANEATFWVAMDRAQGLYGVEQQWLSDLTFRTFSLKDTYRATQCLAAFCERLAVRETYNTPAISATADVFSVQTAQGEQPILQQVDNLDCGASYIASRIQTLHEQGVPYSEMMVLYVSSHHRGAAEGRVPKVMRDCFEACGILVAWASRNAQSKKEWDITADSVSLSTIHSMKGLDAKAVFVWGLDSLEENGMPYAQQQSLAYVACTRARQHLYIVFCTKTKLVSDLESY